MITVHIDLLVSYSTTESQATPSLQRWYSSKEQQILINRKTKYPSVIPHWPPSHHPSVTHLAPKLPERYLIASCHYHSLCRSGYRPCGPCVPR